MQSLTSEFSFSLVDFRTKAKEPSPLKYQYIGPGEKKWFHAFLKSINVK